MIELTLTDFLNIVQTTGMSKLSKIRKIKTREYNPASDYYKPLREAIVGVLTSGGNVNDILPVANGALPIRQQNYKKVAENFIRWISSKKGWKWAHPPHAVYGNGTINISVKPELSFIDKNKNLHVIKIHLNKEPLSKGKLDSAGCLIDKALSSKCNSATSFYFLDLHQGLSLIYI